VERPSRTRRRRPANKGHRYPAVILAADEVQALITACSNRAPTGIRNRALLVLLSRAGCRISEALRLPQVVSAERVSSTTALNHAS
jgi:site-specific recombinase XerD